MSTTVDIAIVEKVFDYAERRFNGNKSQAIRDLLNKGLQVVDDAGI